MSINVNFNGSSIRKPGAYSQSTVSLAGGFTPTATGIIGIVGEANGGAPGADEGVQTFTSQDIAALIAKYKSGPIVDAARLLVAPARDNRVPNGASVIRIFKTNASSASALVLQNAASDDLFDLSSANYGEDENLISVTVAAGTINSAARIITVQKGSTKEILSENPYDAILAITYTGAGSAATLTIQAGVLATTCTGATPDNLAITLAGKTVQDLVDIITAQGSYTVSTTLKLAKARSSADLDPISTPLDIKTSSKTLRAQQKELMDIINGTSSLITASRESDVEGTIAASSKKFLSGAAKGASANSNFQAGFDALLAERCNTIVPLISRDASDDLAEGLSDPSSSYTVDAVNLQAVTHCITASNTKNRSERNCYVSKKSSFAAAQDAAKDLNSERASMLFQDVEVLAADGNLKVMQPWSAACMLAGMQAGMPVGTPATFKFINATGIDHQDYNAKTQAELAIDAGLLPIEPVASGGFRVVVQNSTYSTDANFVFNRPSVLAAADEVAYELRTQLEAIFVGQKARSGSAEAIKNAVTAIMSSFLSAELIVGDDTNKGLGWKDLVVSVTGNVAQLDITITPVQGIDFVLSRITLDNIRQSA